MATYTIDTTPKGSDKGSFAALQREIAIINADIGDAADEVSHLTVTGTWNAKPEAIQEALGKPRSFEETMEASEENNAVQLIATLLKRFVNLKAFRWSTELPFSKIIWPALNPKLSELYLDITVRRPQGGIEEAPALAYFPQDDFRPIVNFRDLVTVFITGMMETYQSTIWELAWRNKKLQSLGLEMEFEPILRRGDWTTSRDNWHTRDATKRRASLQSVPYLGHEGRGILHGQYGHGEYLDYIAIRKARFAAGMNDEPGSLSIRKLHLKNFVVDSFPFHGESFDNLRELYLAKGCGDAGIELPEELMSRVTVKKETVEGEVQEKKADTPVDEEPSLAQKLVRGE